MSHAQYGPNPKVGKRIIRYQSVAGTAAVLIASLAGAPFHQTQWDNPRGPQRAVDYTWSQSQRLPQVLDTTHMREANVSHAKWGKSVKFTSAYGSPRALLSFVPTPLAQVDWPNPRGHGPRLSYSDSFKLPLTTHRGALNYDWPNPRGAKPAVADWESSFPLTLTTVKGTNQYNWPNPAGYRRSGDLVQYGSGLALNNTAPPVVDDTLLPLSNISAAKWSRTVSFKSVSGSPIGLLTAVAADPARQTDWPNPTGPLHKPVKILSLPDMWTQIVAPPFAQTAWPVPAGRGRNEQLGWSDRFKLPLTTVKGRFNYDWPNPRGRTRSGDIGQYGSGLALLVPPVVDDTLLPLPLWQERAWARTVSFKSVYGSPIALTTAGVVTYPASITFDYPNPRGAKPNQSLGWVSSRALYIRAPFSQSDWPVPKGKARVVADWSDRFKLPLTTVKGKFNYDWPVPKGYVPNIGLRTIDGRWFHITALASYDPDRVVCVHFESRTVDVEALSRTVTPNQSRMVTVESSAREAGPAEVLRSVTPDERQSCQES
jgi:hypothetical protein